MDIEKIFEVGFWLVIFLIWFISSQTKRKTKKTFPEEETDSEVGKDILETLGFPFPRIPKKYPTEKKKEKIVPVQSKVKEELKPKLEVTEPTLTVGIKQPSLELFSLDKLQEGIIFSVVLGPPKSKNFLPRWREKLV